MKQYITFLIIATSLLACKKQAGEGGKAKITGKLIIHNYDNSYTKLQNIYSGAGENVFIIYGDEKSVGATRKVAPDGTFEFNYLRKGKYQVFAISKDTSHHDYVTKYSIIKNVEVKTTKEMVDVNEIIVFD